MYKTVFPSSALADSTPLEFTAFVSNVHNMPSGEIELNLELASIASQQAANGDLLNTDTGIAEALGSLADILHLVGVSSIDELEGAEFMIKLAPTGKLPITVYEDFDSAGVKLYIDNSL